MAASRTTHRRAGPTTKSSSEWVETKSVEPLEEPLEEPLGPLPPTAAAAAAAAAVAEKPAAVSSLSALTAGMSTEAILKSCGTCFRGVRNDVTNLRLPRVVARAWFITSAVLTSS
jgi:hypothetical protein